MNFPTLDEIVLETLHLYQKETTIPHIELGQFHTPLVVGSGNGYYTGRIIFRNSPAYFAVEAEVQTKLENISSITDVVVVSASGEKHAPIILEVAKKLGKKTFLISSSATSSGREIADGSVILPKIREPYTYNTSTYFGYMLAENPLLDLVAFSDFLTKRFSDILRTSILSLRANPELVSEEVRNPAQKNITEQDVSYVDMTGTVALNSPLEGSAKRGVDGFDFASFSSFFIVLPDQFVLLREMIEVKFIELFGRRVARDIFTYEQMKHATTVVHDAGELFLCFDNKAEIRYGENQINLPIFHDSSYALMMLTSYFLVGKIQTAFPPYFMQSIEEYCANAKETFGFSIKPWVEV